MQALGWQGCDMKTGDAGHESLKTNFASNIKIFLKHKKSGHILSSGLFTLQLNEAIHIRNVYV